MQNRFKDTMGRYLTASLFKECYVKGSEPMYTMGDEDITHKGRIIKSFKQLYLSLNDPTEYKVATTLLGGWKHWEILCSLSWFKDYVEALRYELEIKIRCQAVETIQQEAMSGGKGALQASKYLADAGYKPKTRGRPSKAEIAAEARKTQDISNRLSEDAERIGLTLVSDKGK